MRIFEKGKSSDIMLIAILSSFVVMLLYARAFPSAILAFGALWLYVKHGRD